MAAARGTYHLDIETTLVGTKIHPGDTLVVITSRMLSSAEVRDAELYFESRLPGVKILFIDRAVGAMVYTPDQVHELLMPPKPEGEGM